MIDQKQREFLPKLTVDQYRAITEAFRIWVHEKAVHEGRWTDEQRACLLQLDPDIWHSSFLYRLIYERKPALPEPPPLLYAYPVYPPDPPEDGDVHPTAKCEHCGEAIRWWGGGTVGNERYPWGWICTSWWWMEGGCPFPDPPVEDEQST